MHRSHTCSELTAENIWEQVTLSGWVSNRRDHGGIIFIDLRDRYGLTQIVFDPEDDKKAHETADGFRSEYVVKAIGKVRSRPEGQANPKMHTWEIEVIVGKVELISKAKTPPFELDGHGDQANEEIRLKYRYLDIRTQRIQEFIKFRSEMTTYTRNWFTKRDFLDVQTPILANSSPEWARDFLVPSRLNPGTFYALPQAPQQFKQLLMVGGIDKYFQIAPCFRDEDPRADRHAGDFYQVDCEMSFVEQEDVFAVVEDYLLDITKDLSSQEVVSETVGKDIIREWGKFFTLTHHEAIEKYGSDKPDLRYWLELVDVADIFARSSNEIFSGIASDTSANRIKAMKVPGGDLVFSKTQMKGFESYVRKFGAGWLGYFQMKEDGLKGPLNKFFEESDLQEIVDRTDLQVWDVIFFGAGERDLVCNYMGRFRVYLAELLELQDPTKISFCWITDFPIFEKDEVTGKIDFEHNPFSMPQGGPSDFDKTGDDLLEVIGYQYDLACNGYEILSWAIRNHDIESLVKAFETVGRSADEVKEKFGAVYEAFQYVPKSGKAQDAMMNSPIAVDEEMLWELKLEIADLED